MKMLNRTVMRIMALILMLALLIASLPTAVADESLYYMTSGKSSKVDIYVRIFVPSAKSPHSSVGHYDLMIKGQLRFHGKTFKNPVFSYRTDGSLEIFSSADTGTVYKHKSKSDYYYGNHMYYYHTSVNGLSNVYSFLSSLGTNVRSVKGHPNSSKALKCELKGKFSDYSVRYVNCFLAVAKWMKLFGKNGLMNYYDAYYRGDKSNYLPATIVKKYRNRLSKQF